MCIRDRCKEASSRSSKRKRRRASDTDSSCGRSSPVETPVVQPHVYHPTKATATVGVGRQREWFCGYCGYRKVSASASTDGMVRVRCPCGGVRGDGKPRMHSNWVQAGAALEKVAEELAGKVCHAHGFRPVLSSRHRPHNFPA
eukprot:TRINITY_DN10633_c0_g1_i2.p2 TRINITY_DN10633_c0_g1~~TRINITY_DN10633_c0_g1_i2.p2  ORF type:complete len:143 (-),score=14.71 TRINITY_DN10633_c0_g1_i2:173-601(-)